MGKKSKRKQSSSNTTTETGTPRNKHIAKKDNKPTLLDETPDNLHFEDPFEEIKECWAEDEKENLAKTLAKTVHGTSCGLSKFDTPDSSLKALDDYITPKEKHKKQEEIKQFSGNALEHVIILNEQK